MTNTQMALAGVAVVGLLGLGYLSLKNRQMTFQKTTDALRDTGISVGGSYSNPDTMAQRANVDVVSQTAVTAPVQRSYIGGTTDRATGTVYQDPVTGAWVRDRTGSASFPMSPLGDRVLT